jgi:hypothetical protein
LSRALTAIAGRHHFVSAHTARTYGTCYFCGKTLQRHPCTNSGLIPIDRHHLIKQMFRDIYREVIGMRLPDNRHNTVWVARGCHEAFNAHHDKAYDGVHFVTEELFRRFMADMEACNFGRLFLPHPAELPRHFHLIHTAA